MWKLVVIHPTKLVLHEDAEIETRVMLDILQYSSSALFGFLYDDKQRLVETYIKKIIRDE